MPEHACARGAKSSVRAAEVTEKECFYSLDCELAAYQHLIGIVESISDVDFTARDRRRCPEGAEEA